MEKWCLIRQQSLELNLSIRWKIISITIVKGMLTGVQKYLIKNDFFQKRIL